eukprot:gene8911-9863_t
MSVNMKEGHDSVQLHQGQRTTHSRHQNHATLGLRHSTNSRYQIAATQSSMETTAPGHLIKNMDHEIATSKEHKPRKISTGSLPSTSTSNQHQQQHDQHGSKTQYLASRYVKKWRGEQNKLSNSIEEKEEDDYLGDDNSVCFDLLQRFPSSPEFSTILHDVFVKKMDDKSSKSCFSI